MSKITNIKRLIKEDFPPEQQDLIDKLAYVVNPFFDQVVAAFNKGINTDNLTRQILEVTVNNTAGRITPGVQFKNTLNTNKILGINIIKAMNITNPAVYPTQAPWISWSINENIITINNITGIQDNNKYTLTLEVIS